MKIGTREWDREVVQDLFEMRDQMLIYGIPLSNRHDDDIRYWCRERSGRFTVKSAYKLLQELKGDWAPNANSGFWRRLWNLKIPPKVKNFLWRASNGFLPTKTALCMKHVPISLLCPTCVASEESTLHCLVKCGFAEACRRETGFSSVADGSVSFAGWLGAAMTQFNNTMVSRLVMLVWLVWKARNSVVWNNTYLHVDEVVRTAQFTLDQWVEAQSRNFDPSIAVIYAMDGKELWTTPERNIIKINVDTALFNDENSYGYGCVARDHLSRMMGARALSFSRVGRSISVRRGAKLDENAGLEQDFGGD